MIRGLARSVSTLAAAGALFLCATCHTYQWIPCSDDMDAYPKWRGGLHRERVQEAAWNPQDGPCRDFPAPWGPCINEPVNVPQGTI